MKDNGRCRLKSGDVKPADSLDSGESQQPGFTAQTVVGS